MSKKYEVTANGQLFGTYEASSEQEARDLCAQDAGYKNEADMVERLEQSSKLNASEISDATTFANFSEKFGSVEFGGKKYALMAQAEFTNRLFAGGFQDAETGEEYTTEYSARAMGEDGYEYFVRWQFDVVKGDEPADEDHDWDDVESVIAA